MLQTMDEAMTLLGGQAKGSESFFTLHGSVTRVDSLGKAGGYGRRISVVIQKGGGANQIMEWRESSLE